MDDTTLDQTMSGNLHIRERVVVSYTRFLNYFKVPILVLYVLLVLASVYPASLLNATVAQSMAPPSGSLSFEAYNHFREKFMSQADATPIVIFATSRDRMAILRPAFINFDLRLNATVKSYVPGGVVSYGSFVTTAAANLPGRVANTYISMDNVSAFSTVVFQYAADDQRTLDFCAFLKTSVNDLTPLLGGHIEVYILGVNAFQDSIAAAATDDLLRMGAVVLPLCCVVFCWHMACLRYLIFPVLSLLVSMMFTYATMTGAAKIMTINAVAPGIIMFLTLALVTNYSIFILNAYKKEASSKLRMMTSLTPDDKTRVVRRMLVSCGLNILISGLTLSLCSVGICIFPLDALRSIGVGCLISVLISTFTTLVLIPTLLLTFSSFFSHGVRETCMENMQACNYCTLDPDDDDMPLLSPLRPKTQQKSKYYKLAVFVTTTPFNIITVIVVLALCAYPMSQAVTINYTNSISLFLPRGGNELIGWNSLVTEFNPGEIYTYRLVMLLKNMTACTSIYDTQCGIFEPGNWAAAQDIIHDIATTVPNTVCRNLIAISMDGIEGCADLDPMTIQTDLYFCMVPGSGPPCVQDVLYDGLILYNMFVPKGKDATWVLIKLDIDPTSYLGHVWYDAMKPKLLNYTQNSPFTVELSGFAAESIDVIDFVHDYFPVMAGLTFGVILVVLTFAYHSLVTPIRCVLNVMVTIGTVWGFGNLVYLHGLLEYFQIDGLKTTGSIGWVAPFAAVMICVRMCLDNDLVYFRRVSELHFGGRTVNESLRVGLADTGPGATAAGVIMMLSFSGLLFSRMAVMNQLGFYLCTTALLETLVMRLVFVPALLSLLQENNWLPRSMMASKFHPTVVGVNEKAHDFLSLSTVDGQPSLFQGPNDESSLRSLRSNRAKGVT